MVKVGFVSQRGPKKALFCRFLFSLHDFPWWSYAYDDHFPWWSKKCHFRPFFTNKIVSTHKSKVVGHQKLVNIGPSDQSFISGKVVFITNNPAEESQVISFQVKRLPICILWRGREHGKWSKNYVDKMRVFANVYACLHEGGRGEKSPKFRLRRMWMPPKLTCSSNT